MPEKNLAASRFLNRVYVIAPVGHVWPLDMNVLFGMKETANIVRVIDCQISYKPGVVVVYPLSLERFLRSPGTHGRW